MTLAPVQVLCSVQSPFAPGRVLTPMRKNSERYYMKIKATLTKDSDQVWRLTLQSGAGALHGIGNSPEDAVNDLCYFETRAGRKMSRLDWFARDHRLDYSDCARAIRQATNGTAQATER